MTRGIAWPLRPQLWPNLAFWSIPEAMPARRRRRGSAGYRGLPADMWGSFGAPPPPWLARSRTRRGGRGHGDHDDEDSDEYSYGSSSTSGELFGYKLGLTIDAYFSLLHALLHGRAIMNDSRM